MATVSTVANEDDLEAWSRNVDVIGRAVDAVQLWSWLDTGGNGGVAKMKKSSSIVRAMLGAASLSALCTVVPAHAVPITDQYLPTPTSPLVTSGSPISFEFDISGQFTTLTSASIAIHVTDTSVTGPNQEKYQYDIGTAQSFSCDNGNCVPTPGETKIIALDADSLADLAVDGKINVTIKAISGDFYFADAMLTAQVTPPVAQVNDVTNGTVPEPATLFLVGAGLVGLGSRFRRRN